MISFSGVHALALKDDDTLWSWGQNGNGQVGNSGNGFIVGYPVMVQVVRNPVNVMPLAGVAAPGMGFGVGLAALVVAITACLTTSSWKKKLG